MLRLMAFKNRVRKLLRNRFFTKSIRYLLIVIIAPIIVLCVLLVSQKVADHFDANGHWDAMSFTGAIVGGAITLLAVKLTLKNQYRMEYMQQYPAKKKSMDELYERLLLFHRHIEECVRIGTYNYIADESMIFLRDSSELKTKAVNAGFQIYSSTNAFLAEVQALSDYMQNPQIDHWKRLELTSECSKTLHHHITSLGEAKFNMEKRYSKLLDPNQHF